MSTPARQMYLSLLERAHVQLTPGLSEAEMAQIETTLGLTFSHDHRELLAAALPVGEYWADWRNLSNPYLQWALTWPVEGVLFDVEEDGFWLEDWGSRPPNLADALAVAREQIERWPRLVPIYSHRYTESGGARGAPVFSVHQTDIVFYGADLEDYLRREFHLGGDIDRNEIQESSPLFPWSNFALGDDSFGIRS
jgi:hypothetical protein